MRSSRDPDQLKTLWEGWHAIARPMREDYARLVSLANEGARALGYAETGVLWRSWYDLPPDEFAKTVERLWSQVAPIYPDLQCYARARLNEKYGRCGAAAHRPNPRGPARRHVGSGLEQRL